jgi:signal transduction histidine kinase
LQRSVKVTLERIARLQDVTAALSEALTPEQVAEVVVANAVPALGAAAGSIYVPSTDGGALSALAYRGYADDLMARWRTIPMTAGIPLTEAARKREPIWMQSSADWAAFSDSPLGRQSVSGDHQAWAAIPLIGDGGLLGVLGLSFVDSHDFSEAERNLAVTLGRQCAQALSRARLYREVDRARARAERHAERSSRLLAVTTELAHALTTEEVATVVVDNGVAAVGAHTGAIWQVDAARTRLHMLRAVGYPDGFRDLPVTPKTPLGDAAASGRPVFLSGRADYAARYPESEERTRQITPADVSAIACLPLMTEGSVHAALALTFAEGRQLDSDDRTFLILLANEAASALDRARRRDAERRERERLGFLAAAGEALSASLDYQQTLTTVARLAVEQQLADWCTVEIVDAQSGARQQLAVAHKDPAKLALADELRRRFPPDPDAPGGLSAVLRTGRPELHPDITPELIAASISDPEYVAILRQLGLSSVMIVPMCVGDRVVGAISFIHAESGKHYDEDDLALARELGRRASLAAENARLYAAAQRAISARDDMLAVVSHDLKNPLGIISMQAELLSRDEAPPAERIRTAAARIQRACNRMHGLISDLLDMASLDEGTLQLDVEPISLPALVAEAIESHAPVATAARVELRAGEVADVRVNCDRERLLRVLANLLANAIRHTPEQGSIELAAAVVDAEVRITVRDTGVGIAPEDQPRVFDRFWRSRGSGKGTGLGLAISRGLVEAHGGRIWVTSTPGQGSTFTFTLPLSRSLAAAI